MTTRRAAARDKMRPMVERCRRVALQMHRLAVTNPTGVHRYAVQLAAALTATAADGDQVELWHGATSEAPDVPAAVTTRTWPLHRRLVHLSWWALHRPLADRFLGDVALVHSLTPAVPVPTRVPLVVTVHDLLTLQHPEWYTPFARRIVGAALHHAARHAARIITPSEVVARDVRTTLGVEPHRVVVVAEGVDDRFRTRLPAAVIADACNRYQLRPGGYAVAVGEVGPRKNLGLLLDALAGITRENRPLLALVGADGGAAAGLREHALRLGVAEQVRWTGRVSDADLVALVQGARVLVHPSHYEGFGLTPLEAMAAGTPVVASSAGSVPEVVGDAGVLLDPDDTPAWRDTISRLAGDDATATDLAHRGVTRAEAFTWERAARETWHIYDTLA